MANSAIKEAKELANYNNKLEQANVKLQYDYNKMLADQDRSFQERMANSAHQREIADLKAAGLNPVLSVSGGNGAATPSGSSASVSKPTVDMSLPKAIIDMATAQLNSATALQTTAMNNANALEQIYQAGHQTRLNQTQQYGYDLGVKQTWSGDSPIGTIYNAADIVDSSTGGSSSSKKSNNPFVNLFNKLNKASQRSTKRSVENYMKYDYETDKLKQKYIKLYDKRVSQGKKVTRSEKRTYRKYKRQLNSTKATRELAKRYYSK